MAKAKDNKAANNPKKDSDKTEKKDSKKPAETSQEDEGTLAQRYETAKKMGWGDQWLKEHPKYAAKIQDGKSAATPKPSGESGENRNAAESTGTPPAQPGSDTPLPKDTKPNKDQVKESPDSTVQGSTANAKDILGQGMEYGKAQAGELIPEGAFKTVDASTSAAMTDYLNKLDEWQKTAQNLTPLEQEAINNLRSSLTGYEAPEVQAMREQAQQEINRNYAGQLKALNMQSARQVGMGRAGGASFAQTQDVLAEKRGVEGDLERDLLVKNADEVQARKQAFANTIRASEDARFGRTSAAQGLYGSALSGSEAANAQKEQFNATQQSNEATARASTATGLAGAFVGTQQAAQAAAQAADFQRWTEENARRQRKWQMRLAKKGYASQENIARITANAVNNA